MTDKLPTKFVTPEIVCSFPALAEMKEDQSGRMAYSLAIALDKNDKALMDKLNQCVSNAAVNKWGQDYADFRAKKIKFYIDTIADDDPYFPGKIKFSAKSQKRQPGCVYPNLQEVPKDRIEEVFYPGAIIRASIDVYATDPPKGGKTIAFSLANVMFVKDGERIGNGSSRAADDFADFADSSFQDDPFKNNDDDDTPF